MWFSIILILVALFNFFFISKFIKNFLHHSLMEFSINCILLLWLLYIYVQPFSPQPMTKLLLISFLVIHYCTINFYQSTTCSDRNKLAWFFYQFSVLHTIYLLPNSPFFIITFFLSLISLFFATENNQYFDSRIHFNFFFLQFICILFIILGMAFLNLSITFFYWDWPIYHLSNLKPLSIYDYSWQNFIYIHNTHQFWGKFLLFIGLNLIWLPLPSLRYYHQFCQNLPHLDCLQIFLSSILISYLGSLYFISNFSYLFDIGLILAMSYLCISLFVDDLFKTYLYILQVYLALALVSLNFDSKFASISTAIMLINSFSIQVLIFMFIDTIKKYTDSSKIQDLINYKINSPIIQSWQFILFLLLGLPCLTQFLGQQLYLSQAIYSSPVLLPLLYIIFWLIFIVMALKLISIFKFTSEKNSICLCPSIPYIMFVQLFICMILSYETIWHLVFPDLIIIYNLNNIQMLITHLFIMIILTAIFIQIFKQEFYLEYVVALHNDYNIWLNCAREWSNKVFEYCSSIVSIHNYVTLPSKLLLKDYLSGYYIYTLLIIFLLFSIFLVSITLFK